jgi:DNA-binding GntR family transcriptional regulator
MTRDRVDGDQFPLTQEFIAQMLAVRRTTVSEIAGKLQADGLIRYRRGQLTIVDRPRLEELACSCYAVVRDEFARSDLTA